MPKFQFLLLDAGIIIGAHELGVWEQLINQCTITITNTVKDQEVYYWYDEHQVGHKIDLDQYIQEGKLNCVEIPRYLLEKFLKVFDPTYLDRLDPGESDSLAFLLNELEKCEDWLISSSDAIVYTVLGRLHLSERGISLEEILQQIGLDRSLAWKYSREFRTKYTRIGEQDSITGIGLQKDK